MNCMSSFHNETARFLAGIFYTKSKPSVGPSRTLVKCKTWPQREANESPHAT